MNEEQKIVEFANALEVCGHGRVFGAHIIAKELINAGFGNVQEALTEFTEELNKEIDNNSGYFFGAAYVFVKRLIHDTLNKIKERR